MPNYAVILPAAGQSSRFRDPNYKKPFAPLAGRAVWLYAIDRFLNRPDVKQVLVVISPEDREHFDFKFSSNVAILGIEIIEGGQERADSIEKALARVRPDVEYVAIHDAVRPCLAETWVDSVFEAAHKTGAAILATPVAATLKRVGTDKRIQETVARDHLWEAQTPQVFRRELLMEAYAKRGGFVATDDAQLVERLGKQVTIVQGSPLNIKITTADDLRLAEQALKVLPKPKFQGPAHPFEGDELWR